MDIISFLMGVESGTGVVEFSDSEQFKFEDENLDGNIVVTKIEEDSDG